MTRKQIKEPAKGKNISKKDEKVVDAIEEHDEEEEHEAVAEIDPDEKEIAELLSKPKKAKKVERHDIDSWLIDREIESAEKGDDWF